jgi:hypothetical protein
MMFVTVLCSAALFAQQASPNLQPESHGKVLFSRSVDDTQHPPEKKSQDIQAKATDA